jgi:hypothetical protein
MTVKKLVKILTLEAYMIEYSYPSEFFVRIEIVCAISPSSYIYLDIEA